MHLALERFGSLNSNWGHMFWNKKKTEPSSGFTKSTKSGFSSDDGGSSDEKLSRWSLLSNSVVSHNALIWFREMKPTEFAGNAGKDELRVHKDFIKGIDTSLQDLAETSSESDFQYLVSTLRDFAERFNPQVFPEMEVNLGSCDQVEIRESDLGQKIILASESQGVRYIETSELGIDEEASGILIRWHDTDAGHPNFQYLRVYEDLRPRSSNSSRLSNPVSSIPRPSIRTENVSSMKLARASVFGTMPLAKA